MPNRNKTVEDYVAEVALGCVCEVSTHCSRCGYDRTCRDSKTHPWTLTRFSYLIDCPVHPPELHGRVYVNRRKVARPRRDALEYATRRGWVIRHRRPDLVGRMSCRMCRARGARGGQQVLDFRAHLRRVHGDEVPR